MKHATAIKPERDFANWLSDIENHRHCERVAGSGSRIKAVCDVIVFLNGQSYLGEIKATRFPLFRINGRVRIQIEKLISTAKAINQPVLLIILFKRRGWVFIKLNENYPKKINFYALQHKYKLGHKGEINFN